MTREDIIRMAREAGFVLHAYPDENWLKLMARFTTLVAAAEREACAKVCEDEVAEQQKILDEVREVKP